MATYAGRYDEPLLKYAGGRLVPATSATVAVYEEDGSTLATVYADRTKATTAANPVSPDAHGNLEFFAEPGTYVLSVVENGTVQDTVEVSVPYDPEEVVQGGVTSVDGNTGAVTAAQLLASIKTVDGAGSGLDADLLDGSSAAAFATAAQGATADTAVQPGDDAADLGSGAASDGYVLTADGAGGAAWEAAPGGGGGGATNLAWDAATSKVTSDTGTDATLTAVDGTNPGLMTVAQKSKLDGIEAGATADQTAAEVPIADAGGYFTGTHVEAALQEVGADLDALSGTYVAQSTLDANTLLGATVDNTPVAFPVAASRIVGRKATGDIDDLTTAELAALFGTPDGTKFLADDGTLKVPSGGSATQLRPIAISGTRQYGLPGCIGNGQNATTAAAVAGTTYYTPFVVDAPITVSSLAMQVTTAIASAKGRIGIFAADADWTPGARQVDSGELDCSTTGAKAVTGLSVVLPAGRYLMAVITDSAIVWRAYVMSPLTMIGTALGNSSLADFTVTGTYGAFPSTGTAWTAASTSSSSGFINRALMAWS